MLQINIMDFSMRLYAGEVCNSYNNFVEIRGTTLYIIIYASLGVLFNVESFARRVKAQCEYGKSNHPNNTINYKSLQHIMYCF